MPCRTESVKRPAVLSFIVAKNIVIPIVREHAEIGGSGRVPLAVYFANIKEVIANGEAQRPFVSSVTGVALDVNVVHSCFLRNVGRLRSYSIDALGLRNYD